MSRFIEAATDYYINLDYVWSVSVSGSNVELTVDESAVGSSISVTISFGSSAEAQAAAKAIAQPFDPKA